jgi:hypothetical protein
MKSLLYHIAVGCIFASLGAVAAWGITSHFLSRDFDYLSANNAQAQVAYAGAVFTIKTLDAVRRDELDDTKESQNRLLLSNLGFLWIADGWLEQDAFRLANAKDWDVSRFQIRTAASQTLAHLDVNSPEELGRMLADTGDENGLLEADSTLDPRFKSFVDSCLGSAGWSNE